MSTFKIIFASMIALGIGIIYFAFNEQWIIIRSPLANTLHQSKCTNTAKKECILWYRNNNCWRHEKTMLLWSENHADNSKRLINSLLSLLNEEHALTKKIIIDSALISASGQELFLSFSQNIFDKEESLVAKWMRVESILRTLRENQNLIQSVRFLVQHQPLRDTQLDFSQSWPVQGFMENMQS